MDNISFIPANQKNLNGSFLPEKQSRPYIGTFVWLIICLIVYGAVSGMGYWFFIRQRTDKVVNRIAELDAQNQAYYPKGDLEQSFFNITDIIQKRRDINKVIEAVESKYIPNLKVNNLVYVKQNNTLLLSAVAPTFEAVTTQVDAINQLPEVLPSDVPAIEGLADNSGASFNFIIKLK